MAEMSETQLGGMAAGNDALGNPGDAMAADLKRMFSVSGYQPVDPQMMLPAEVVLDRLGENLRRRLLLVTGPDGREMCMRPDFTIPVAAGFLKTQAQLQTNKPNKVDAAARFAYAGLAFRFPSANELTRTTAEFRQAGIEHFGDQNTAAADAEVLSASLGALAEAGLTSTKIILGDVALFTEFVSALGLSARRKKQFLQKFRKVEFATNLVADMGDAVNEPGPDAAFAEALSSMESDAARAMVEEVMEMAGAKPVGGRTPAEIAQRFVEQAQTSREGPLDDEVIALLQGFIGLDDAPQNIVADLRQLAQNLPAFAPAIDRYEERLDLMDKANIDFGQLRFKADFSGRIDYYTGMVFDIRSAQDPELGVIASGGRYDGFLADMGARQMTPAVGASIYVDRLVATLAQPGWSQ